MPVNAFLSAPTPPGPWVDEDHCACGASYHSSHFSIRFTDGATLLRTINQSSSGGYRSRRAVLWAMRVLKLQHWYNQHWACGWALEDGNDD